MAGGLPHDDQGPSRRVMVCDFCGREFDPIATRWLCPWCHQKANCCDGAPLPEAPFRQEGQEEDNDDGC